MNQLELNRLNDISKTDTTDKNKKSFERLQKNINHRLVPEFKEYEKKLNIFRLRQIKLVN